MSIPNIGPGVRDSRPSIIVLADYYLPGFRAGGPIRTLSNLVEQLGQEYRFSIITRDRDLGDDTPYSDVVPAIWRQLGSAQVYHANPEELKPIPLARLLVATNADLLYLNSFFSPRMSILPLALRKLKRIPSLPVVLAPRGEFASGALALKPKRKHLYLHTARVLGMFSGVHWQATSSDERDRIKAVIGAPEDHVHVAPNLPSASLQKSAQTEAAPAKERIGNHLRLVFLSRISPMKNVDHLLCALKHVRSSVFLTVYGPIGDANYWRQCQAITAQLPAHIGFRYGGEVSPNNVAGAFAANDAFLLPSRGENFGHVILESLCAGTPVVVSDRTPWHADAAGGITVLPLQPLSVWAAAIDSLAADDDAARCRRRAAARAAATAYLQNSPALSGHRELFKAALYGSNPVR